MQTIVLFPVIEGQLAFNVSGSFDLEAPEHFAEVYVAGLPAGHKVVFERGFLLGSCEDVTWFLYKEPCCPDLEVMSDPVFITMPGKFRAIVLRDDGGAPLSDDLMGLRIFVNIIHDGSGALRLRHNCCGVETVSLCDNVSDLPTSNPIGG